MSGLDLATLRTAKIAMSEELITPDDFLVIKNAFLKAQQIKAGLDAGFIREEDYRQARDSFLHSLDFMVHQPVAHQVQQHALASPAAQAEPVAASVRPSPWNRPPPHAQTYSAPPGSGSVPTLSPSNSGGIPGNLQEAARGSGGGVGPGPSSLSNGSGLNGSGNGRGNISFASTVPIPTDMPRGRGNSMAGKKSMSGISVSEQCIDVYNMIKTKSAYKWVSFKVNDAGNEVMIDQLGSRDSTYDDFVATLPDNSCRYAVYDYAYGNADTKQTIQKLVFLHWAPESASIKGKMMYASTKDLLKGQLEGIGADFQATDFDELAESEMRERVHAALTRK